MKAFHFDPAVYPDPYRCDLFRFSKLRNSEESDTKYGFATVDSNVCCLYLTLFNLSSLHVHQQYLPFSGGKKS